MKSDPDGQVEGSGKYCALIKKIVRPGFISHIDIRLQRLSLILVFPALSATRGIS